MRYKNILVPFDGSDPAKRALDAALDLVGDEMTCTVHIVRFFDDDESSGGFFSFLKNDDDSAKLDISAAKDELDASLEDLLDKQACHSRVACATCDDPVEGIVDYVEASAIDMVVMGSRGLGSVRSMFGSVSNGVLHDVSVPVLVVK